MTTKIEFKGSSDFYYKVCLKRVKELKEKGFEAKVIFSENLSGWAVEYKIK